MAGVLESSLDPKHQNYFAEVFEQEDRDKIARRSAYHKEYKSRVFKELFKDRPTDPLELKKRSFEQRRLTRTVRYKEPETFFPRKLRFRKGTTCWDYNGATEGGQSVSERLKTLIEAIEPGVHQFAPVDIFQKDGSFHARCYYWHVPVAIDAINPDLGGVQTVAGPVDGTQSWTIAPGRRNLAVYKAKVAGRAAWFDVRSAAFLFISDALVSGMRRAGMEGWTISSHWLET